MAHRGRGIRAPTPTADPVDAVTARVVNDAAQVADHTASGRATPALPGGLRRWHGVTSWSLARCVSAGSRWASRRRLARPRIAWTG